MFELKIIHWEYIKSNEDVTSVELPCKPNIVVDPKSKKPNGILLKFPIKIFKGGKLTLNCIGEQVFVHEDIIDFTFEEVKYILQQASNEFNEKFEARYFIETGLKQKLLMPPTDFHVRELLEYIQSKRL